MLEKIEALKKLNGTDLTKVVYPIVIFLTGWYIVANIHMSLVGKFDLPYIVFWTLVPVSFIYLAIKGIKLKFRWSVLSVIGIIMIIAFALSVCLEIASPHFNLADFFLTGSWDHFFFPIAFGLFFLCDLRGLPRLFWLMLAPFALMNIMGGNLSVIGDIFNKSIIPEGPPGFFGFFDVESWAEFNTVPLESVIRGLAFYIREQLTFFTTLPIVIFYYLIKKGEVKNGSNPL